MRARFDPAGQGSRALRAMLAWLDLDRSQLRALLAGSVFASRTVKAFADFPQREPPAIETELGAALCATLTELVETVDDYRALAEGVPGLRLALDTGHCLVSGERDPAGAVRETIGELGTVSVEDMRRGERPHRAFGEGDMNVAAVLQALRDAAWSKLVCVELSRDANRADTMISCCACVPRRRRRPIREDINGKRAKCGRWRNVVY